MEMAITFILNFHIHEFLVFIPGFWIQLDFFWQNHIIGFLSHTGTLSNITTRESYQITKKIKMMVLSICDDVKITPTYLLQTDQQSWMLYHRHSSPPLYNDPYLPGRFLL